MGNLHLNVKYLSFSSSQSGGVRIVYCLLFETFMSIYPEENQLLAFDQSDLIS